MTDCLITAITRSVMLTAIHNQPKFSNLFMDHLLSRNSRIQADVVDQLFNSSEKRMIKGAIPIQKKRPQRRARRYLPNCLLLTRQLAATPLDWTR
jgi:CRP/FNR family transcriptional regulator, cyclic AMP receptor protein